MVTINYEVAGSEPSACVGKLTLVFRRCDPVNKPASSFAGWEKNLLN